MIEEIETAMETDENNGTDSQNPLTTKKYFIDTTSIKVPRKGMEMVTGLKDGMGKGPA